MTEVKKGDVREESMEGTREEDYSRDSAYLKSRHCRHHNRRKITVRSVEAEYSRVSNSFRLSGLKIILDHYIL